MASYDAQQIGRQAPDQLYKACQQIFQNADDLPRRGVHRTALSDYKATVENGYPICPMARENATKHGQVDVLIVDIGTKKFSNFMRKRIMLIRWESCLSVQRAL